MTRPAWLGADLHVWDHIRVHNRLLEDERLSIYELGVWLAIAYFANVQTGGAWPSQKSLAILSRCSERRVRDSVKRLIDLGWLTVENSPGKPTKYKLLSPPTPAPGAAPPGTTRRTTPARRANEQEPVKQEPRTRDFKGNQKPETYARLPEWTPEYQQILESLPVTDPEPVTEREDVKAQAAKARQAKQALNRKGK